MNSLAPPQGILGGTFDPIHNTHIACAALALQHCYLAKVRFLPCQDTVHKPEASASSAQRLAMLELALHNQENMRIDTRELERFSPSYTLESLQSLHKEFPNTPLVFILGSDMFQSLPEWNDWEDMFECSHFAVIPRPHWNVKDLSTTMLHVLAERQCKEAEHLQDYLAGKVYILDDEINSAISSSQIREKCAKGIAIDQLVPETISQYIKKHRLYS